LAWLVMYSFKLFKIFIISSAWSGPWSDISQNGCAHEMGAQDIEVGMEVHFFMELNICTGTGTSVICRI
jgi:hypothetical protein